MPSLFDKPARTGLAFALSLTLACAPAADVDTESEEPAVWSLGGTAPQAASPRGAVSSGHPLASKVGAEVLAAGGNAVDAAVAVGFALAAVLPTAGNIGGGGFLVCRSADGEVKTLDYRERAPAASSRDMYLDEAGEPTDKSVTGHLASGVPGSVAGLAEMHRELGTMDWASLVLPAAALADGHEIDEPRHDSLEYGRERLAEFETSRRIFLTEDGEALPVGTQWQQPELAKTLRLIASEGPQAFYEGEIADLLVAEMERGGGIITKQDLADYEAVWREPIQADYRGYTIYSMPPPSSGGVTLALILNILEGYGELPAFGTTELIHLQAEAMRRAFTDRNRYLGDPDFLELPLERLQSQEYADELRAQIDPQKASVTEPYVEVSLESTQTTHYSIVDADGNAASVTTTINGSFGSAVAVDGAGFLLNNEMDDFAAAPGKPNQFGLVEGENNAIAPGKRMLSSMTPSIVLDPSGELFLVVGTPGGPTIITSVFHAVSNVLDHGMTLAEAIESPRAHHQALPDLIFVENAGFSEETLEGLRALGHEVRVREGVSGDVDAVIRTGDSWLAVADPRRGSGVAAVPESP